MMIKHGPNLAAHQATERLVASILGGSPWVLCETTAAAADLDPARPVTMPGHDVTYIEHARGHAKAEYAKTREGAWVIRADAAYVEQQLAEGTLEVTTRRGPTKLIKIASVGVPFTTVSGRRLVYVRPVPEGTPRRGGPRLAHSVPIRGLTGTTPCDHCGRLVRALFEASDREGYSGLVCVRCDALEPGARSYGPGLAEAA